MNLVRNGRNESFPPTTVGPHVYRYGLVGQSGAIGEVIRLIELVSASCSTVLVTGETGTGKGWWLARSTIVVFGGACRSSTSTVRPFPRRSWNQTWPSLVQGSTRRVSEGVSRAAAGRRIVRIVRVAHVGAAGRVPQDSRRHAVLRDDAIAHIARHVLVAHSESTATASAGSSWDSRTGISFSRRLATTTAAIRAS